MSKETAEWLNTQTLIGFTSKRGNAWHYSASLQGDEPNHYDEAIPVDDVIRRLFGFTVESRPLYIRGSGGYIEIPDRQAQVTSDDETVLGVFKAGYVGHDYREWLVENVERILNDDSGLSIGSAGLLRNRAQAWVSVEVPDNIETPQGVTFRPNLVACTSFDGSLATTYKRTVTNVVCDNTLAAGLSDAGEVFRAKHTRYSGMRIKNAQSALAIVESIADDFAEEVKRLCEWTVDADAWAATLDALVPVTEDMSARATTFADHKRDALETLYANDLRVAPWAGTAFGVLQAFNTYEHHGAIRRGEASRVQKNREHVLSGKMAANDAAVLSALATISN
jgi:phage/plasmid-like protein (TIGR03299 family)